MLALPLALCVALLAQEGAGTGRIGGQVVNATRRDSAEAGVEVLLQVLVDGTFEVIGRAATSPEGRFLFEGIPLDEPRVYLAGASRDGILYPGPRVTLGAGRSEARVRIQVHESITGPSPLVIRDHVVEIEPEPGAVRVTEALRIENPGTTTFVGQARPDGSDPVTLELRIPPGFERVTFQKEFFGRQFAMRDGHLVTGIPWTPGTRELAFTYVVPVEESSARLWERPLDLPCDHVRIVVRGQGTEALTCSLGAPRREPDGAIVFESTGSIAVAAGPAITLDRPAGWSLSRAQVRWAVLGGLALAIVASLLTLGRRSPAPVRRPSRLRGRARTSRA